MAVVHIAHWITITLSAVSQLQEQAMVFSYRSTPDVNSSTECTTIAQDFWNYVGPLIRLTASQNIQFTKVTCSTHYPSGTNYTGVYDIVPPSPGLSTEDQVPQNAAEVVSWRTGYQGRSYRGRSFMYGVPEGELLGSTIIAAQLTRLIAAFANVAAFSGSAATALRFVIASRKLLILIDVASAIFDLVTRSQRDRLPGERRHRRRVSPLP